MGWYLRPPPRPALQLDAVHALAPKEVPVGSAILRPSYRRNPNELDVTIKIAQLAAGPVFAVTFLRESDKPQGRGEVNRAARAHIARASKSP